MVQSGKIVMRKAFCLILVLLFASSVSATSIQTENVTVDLDTKQVEVDTQVKELTSTAFTYITSYPVENVKATINGQATECETSPLQVGTEITCQTNLRTDFTVNIEFEEDGLTSVRNNAEIFSYTQSIYRPTDNYRLKVLLPSGILVLLGVSYLVWIRKTRDDISETYEDLSQDEIEVIEILLENDGQLLQKDVVNESSYSKAKISGLVSSLVDKEIITKQKEGRSNELKISKKYSH